MKDKTKRKQNMKALGRLGGLATSACNSPADYCRAGLAAANSLERWLVNIPADIPQDERLRRAAAARRLWYAKIGGLGGRAGRRIA